MTACGGIELEVQPLSSSSGYPRLYAHVILKLTLLIRGGHDHHDDPTYPIKPINPKEVVARMKPKRQDEQEQRQRRDASIRSRPKSGQHPGWR